MKSSTITQLACVAGLLSWCAMYDKSIQNRQDVTTGEVNRLLWEVIIPNTMGGESFLQLWPSNIEFAVNDPNCSIDPSESHKEYLPEDYDLDSVTACLYEGSWGLYLDLEKHDI